MDRTLSSDIDSALSTRNQGQLVSTQRVTTETLRTPGLSPVASPGGEVRPVAPGELQGIDLSVPFFGTINWRSLALGALGGVLLWKITTRRRRAATQRAKSAVAKALS